MAEYADTLTFTSTASLNAQVAANGGSWSGLSDFVVNGLLVNRLDSSDLFRIAKYVGQPNVPADLKRLRRSVHQVMQRMGQPVIVKHMFNDADAQAGVAEKSPNFQSAYGQVRNRDPFSHGIGYCSVERANDEWVNPSNGRIVTATSQPGDGYVQAPKYRGYGPGYLTYIIEPDAAEDVFKLSPTGALIKVQSQTVQMAWFPEVNDNDLIVNVELDRDGNVIDAHERYQAKMTNPVSMRGLDRRGRREYSGDNGNRHVVNQTFEMTLVPDNNVLMNVEIDR